MTSLSLSVKSVAKGVRLCLADRAVRTLALRPWLLGILCGAGSLVGVYYAHGPLVSRIVAAPDSLLQWAAYVLAWVAAALLLAAAAVVLSFMAVLVLAGFFHTAIAEHILRQLGKVPEPDSPSAAAYSREALRSLSVEALKLIWIAPLFALLFVLGFIPPLLPIVLVLSAWLIAYQAVDFALDVLKYPVSRRIGYALRHFIPLAIFGGALVLLGLIPLAIVFLPPIAVAGGAWLVGQLPER